MSVSENHVRFHEDGRLPKVHETGLKNLMYMQMVVAGVFEDDSNTNKLSKNQVGLMFYTKKK